jgi:lysozyme family protein
MPQWPKDTEADRDAFYGDPGKGQIDAQMVPVIPPFAMFYTDDKGKTTRVKKIMFHRKCAPNLLAALNEIWDYCGRDQAKIDASGASKYFGAYEPRKVRGSATKWSNHAYAAAIDLNALQNALGMIGNMPQFIVDAFCRQGAMWGGWYKGRKDYMHFEFVDNGGRKPQSMPPIVGAKPAEAAVSTLTVAKAIDTGDRRTRMGRMILSFEARRDKNGHLEVYKLPANDGGGTYEVAGINDRYHPEQASHLAALIRAGRFDEAEATAVEYMVKYTDVAAGWTTNAGVEFYLRDCVFNRGPGGAANILQIALGVGADGSIGTVTREALSKVAPAALLDQLRVAREHYEDQVAPGRPNLRQGLINRWNKALVEAKKFAAETPTTTQQNTAKAVVGTGGVAGAATITHGVKEGWGLLDWSLLAGGVVLAALLAWLAFRYVWPRFRAWRAQPTPQNAAPPQDGDKGNSVPVTKGPVSGPADGSPARLLKPAVKSSRARRRAPRKPAAKPMGKKKPTHNSPKRKAA